MHPGSVRVNLLAFPGGSRHEPTAFQRSGNRQIDCAFLFSYVFLPQETLQRLQQRVRAQFPRSSLSDPAKDLDDLPLLGARPRISAPIPEGRPHTPKTTVASSETSPQASGDVISGSFGVFPGYEGATMTAPPPANNGGLPAAITWPTPDLTFFQDDIREGVPLIWPGNDQQWQPLLHEGISNSPPVSSNSGLSSAEVAQWNQLLDHLGVWE
jgi:hypothetical protein